MYLIIKKIDIFKKTYKNIIKIQKKSKFFKNSNKNKI